MTFVIDVEREVDGRWIAEVPALPGVMAYGSSREEAIVRVQALAQRVLDSLNTNHDPDADAHRGHDIAGRVQQVQDGAAVTLSAEESIRQAYAHLAARRN